MCTLDSLPMPTSLTAASTSRTLQGSIAHDIPAAPLDEPTDEEIEWVDVKSENGVAFKYGVKKSDLEQTEDAPRAAFASRPSEYLSMHCFSQCPLGAHKSVI